MATVSSSSGIQAAVQSGFQQIKLQEARRNAAQAEQAARSLASQAQSAQRVADRAQDNARSLYVQSSEAQQDAGRARQGIALIRSNDQALERLGSVASQVIERLPAETVSPAVAAASATPVAPVAPVAPVPVVNTQGQLTGTLLSTTA